MEKIKDKNDNGDNPGTLNETEIEAESKSFNGLGPVCALKEPAPRCIVAPCSHPHCPAYPKATCVSFCPCTAEYYRGLHKVNCHPTPTANLCHLKFCGIDGVCKVVNGKAVCQSKAPTKNPCHLKFCGIDGICKVVNGKAVCQSKGAVCSSPKLVGPCKAIFPRFFFNSKTQQCEKFYYGGCHGNKNNFETKELCEGTCKPKENVCSLPKVVGPCEARTLRYYHNFKTRRCERFFYGGCGGNENNFDTLSQCQKTCARKVGDVCSLPKVAGPCKGSITRYYHNSKTRRCERFFYGGCGGNKNNFDTLSQCQRTCARKDPCASISCKAGMECKVILRRAMCRPILANPCIAILCLAGRKCVVVNGEGRCIPSKPSCAAVLCLKGKKCVIINGRPTCATPCSSHPDCKQQGSFCSNLGVCECSRLCPAIHQPVCDSDGRRYSNRCQLDIAACRKKTTITSVICPGDVKSTQ